MPLDSRNDPQALLRAHVLDLLSGDNAHLNFDQAIQAIATDRRARTLPNLPYTAWQLLEHLRLAQFDILEFSRNTSHRSPKWPEGYWPEAEGPKDEAAWELGIERFQRDREAFAKLIGDPSHDLLQPLPGAPDGQTLLREALVLADHNSYHVGQLVLLSKLSGGSHG